MKPRNVRFAPWLVLLVCGGVLALAHQASGQTGQGPAKKKTTGTTQATPAKTTAPTAPATPNATTPGTTAPSEGSEDSESIGTSFLRIFLMFLEELLGDWLEEIASLLDELFGDDPTPEPTPMPPTMPAAGPAGP